MQHGTHFARRIARCGQMREQIGHGVALEALGDAVRDRQRRLAEMIAKIAQWRKKAILREAVDLLRHVDSDVPNGNILKSLAFQHVKPFSAHSRSCQYGAPGTLWHALD